MFYEVEVKSHVRVPPPNFKKDVKSSILESLKEQFSNFVSKELGISVCVSEVMSIKDGVLIPGDGAAYYDTSFKLITFKPEMQEVVQGLISEIAEFGAFINIGPTDGMIHISQTMDDFVSFSKAGVLTGKETKKVLKAGDKCRARIIALSYKELMNPKIGLTMRQPWLGPLKHIEEDLKNQKKETSKEDKKK
ncbi:MAG: DNA-directed RNA polymerase [Nanoarchaeota archaeon]